MKRLFALLVVASVCHIAIGQDKPVPPVEAASKMTMPPGFKATLFAGEPDVVQPIAFAFDDRGRMWVVECLSYPKWTLDGTGHDRVVMFEDTDGDGKHDKRTVIYDQGSNLSSVELGHGGIWLCSTPNLVFIPCDFNADKPTVGKPEIVLDGWNVKDTKHNIFNSLIWGPDGWLYGCNGIQSKSIVGKPGAAAKDRVEMNCGVWRFHPTRKIFEAFAHGSTNPFGLDYDEYGEMFITNCVIKHLFHVVPGGHYDRMYGEDINKHSYQLMHSIADYIHWAGGDWTTSRGNKPEHSDAGGGHAHSGAMIYLGDNFPDEYRNTLFTANIHGNRLNRDLLKRSGSGYKAERAKDFLFANDPWFRGIAVHAGPDGGVYVSDWSDTGECHNYDKVDLTNGRIFKVVYGTPKAWTGDLSKLSLSELVKLQAHKNDWFARHARRILFERGTKGERAGVLTALQTAWPKMPRSASLKLAWVMSSLGDWSGAETVAGVSGPSPEGDIRRASAIRMMLEAVADGTAPELTPEKGDFTLQTAVERLAFASGLRRLPSANRLEWTTHLLKWSKAEDANDQNLPLMVWYAIEPQVALDLNRSLGYLTQAKIPLVREYIARKLTSLDRANIRDLVEVVSNSDDTMVQGDVLQGILDGLGGAREENVPSNWNKLSQKLVASTNSAVRERAMNLAVVFGDDMAIESMKRTVADRSAETNSRASALHILLRRGKPDLLPILKDLLADPSMRAEAIRGLAAFKDEGTPALLLKAYPTLTDIEKEDTVQTLASRPTWALALLDAIDKGAVPRRDVSAFIARQMQGLKDKRVVEQLDKVWGKIQPASSQRAVLTTKYKGLLTDAALANGDLAKGRQMYVKNCASCHKLYDDGGDVGPALTGAQRSNLDYILENVLDPSAVVPNDYRVSVIQLQNGRLINGIIKSETEKSITVRTSNETIVVPKPDIESRTVSKLSMMPDGIFEKMADDEVRDLVAYLRGREQVPLPKAPK